MSGALDAALTGSCLCGGARFEAMPPLGRAGYCHPGIRPSFRQFVDFAAPWEPIPDDGLERVGGSAWTSAATGTM